jgi:hypothetical protein
MERAEFFEPMGQHQREQHMSVSTLSEIKKYSPPEEITKAFGVLLEAKGSACRLSLTSSDLTGLARETVEQGPLRTNDPQRGVGGVQLQESRHRPRAKVPSLPRGGIRYPF